MIPMLFLFVLETVIIFVLWCFVHSWLGPMKDQWDVNKSYSVLLFLKMGLSMWLLLFQEVWNYTT